MDDREIRRFGRVLRALRLDDASTAFGTALGSESNRAADSLLVVGTPECEPWHFVAHLADAARLSGRPDLMPTWIRWAAPERARAHLSVTMERLAAAGRGDTVLVVAPTIAGEHLLDRVSDARNAGGRILTLNREDRDLAGLAHEALEIPTVVPPRIFEVVQHVIANAAPGSALHRARRGRVA
jgi:hypothetical protein